MDGDEVAEMEGKVVPQELGGRVELSEAGRRAGSNNGFGMMSHHRLASPACFVKGTLSGGKTISCSW
jgi:hypothetical protein